MSHTSPPQRPSRQAASPLTPLLFRLLLSGPEAPEGSLSRPTSAPLSRTSHGAGARGVLASYAAEDADLDGPLLPPAASHLQAHGLPVAGGLA